MIYNLCLLKTKSNKLKLPFGTMYLQKKGNWVSVFRVFIIEYTLHS